MKETYEAPKAECIRFDKADVITTSGCTYHWVGPESWRYEGTWE